MKDHAITKKDIVKALSLKTEEMARRYIAGIAKPRHEKMVKLARLLRFPNAAALEYGEQEVEDHQPPATGEAARQYGLSKEAAAIATAWSRLPDFKKRQYQKAIMTDATLLEIFPELEAAMRAALVAADPDYHKLTEGFEKARAQLERQAKLDL